jgi:hypothetical protein
VPAPGVWSVGKEAEHVAEGAVLHQWIVRLSVGERVGASRPGVERKELTTRLTPAETVDTATPHCVNRGADVNDVRWKRYPLAAASAHARAWLTMQASTWTGHSPKAIHRPTVPRSAYSGAQRPG